MSARLNADGTATEIAGDIAPTPNPPAYAEAEAKPSTIIYKSHGGRPNHVPLCESSKNDLHRAVRDSDPAKLADLLADPAMLAKINDADMFGFRPLHLACQTTTTGPKLGAKDPDCIACAELLISAGADVNVQTTEDQWSQTPLMLAVSSLYPHVEVCEMLLGVNVDLCVTDVYGNTALHNAAMGTHVAQLKVLAKHPDWEKATAIKNKSGETALQLAEEVCRKQEAKVEKGPNHDECKMIFETRRGFEQLDEIDEANRKKKGGKGGKKAASSA